MRTRDKNGLFGAKSKRLDSLQTKQNYESFIKQQKTKTQQEQQYESTNTTISNNKQEFPSWTTFFGNEEKMGKKQELQRQNLD
jgi:hypothetical protein